MNHSRRDFLGLAAFLGIQTHPLSGLFYGSDQPNEPPRERVDVGNPYLQEYYAPITEEVFIENLPITGALPPEISGAYFRNGPNPQHPHHHHHWFDGDGMIHRIGIQDGKANYRNRYVQTQAWSWERSWGKLFPGIYEVPKLTYGARTAATALLLKSVLKDTSNTDLICFKNQIISLWWLSGVPYSLDPETLEPMGAFNFKGYNGNVSAHARIDPRTGDLFFLDFSQILPWVCVVAVDSTGAFKWKRRFDLPAPRVYHDILFTENYVVLMDFPVGLQPKAGICLDRSYASRVILIPRDGVSPEIVFETESCYVLHGLNAYEQNGAVLLSVSKFDDPFGRSNPAEEPVIPYVGSLRVKTRPVLWVLDLQGGSRTIREEVLDDENTEFPRINDEYLGIPSRYSYHPRLAPEKTVKFNGLIKHNWKTGEKQVLELPKGQIGEEFVFIPRSSRRSEDDGWLVSMVRDTAENGANEFVVYDAESLNPEPVAKVSIPCRVPFGFHSKWVPN